MRRLSGRERRLVIALCGVAVLGAVSFYMAPSQGPNPEEVLAYYAHAFGTAKQITIRPATSGAEPVTVTRETAGRLFSKLENYARYGGVTTQTMPQPPRYLLDIVGEDGSETKDISVGFTVDSPKQPARGKLALLPREIGPEGMSPMPVMALAIEDYLDELHNPVGAKERREKRHEEMERQMQALMGRQGQDAGRRAGRGATGTAQTPPGGPTRSK